ncbi:hypothetical protein [Escherichia coli]|uniref:hypothetical protein n=1 Tax=Escherichia coli TaxID=562 RepID=UPI00201F46C1|nr:hypothetical protein [Escherichia coli]
MTSLKTSIKTITYLSDIGCLEIQGASLPSVSGEDRILQAMIAAFFLLTPLIILILRKLFMREMFEFWVYVFSLGICLVCGWWLFWGRFIFCY